MIILRNVELKPDTNFNNLRDICAKNLNISCEDIISCSLYKRSIDARKKSDVHFNCSFLVDIKCNEENILRSVKNAECYEIPKIEPIVPIRDKKRPRPIVVGSGPAGFFATLTLARQGYFPILIERGKDVDERTKDVNKFWNEKILNTSSNVQFGEGGAGTFSDGKLNTGTKDLRKRQILEDFVSASAPEEILFDSEPHIGTDRLISVVKNIRNEIILLGGNVLFEHQLVNIKLNNNAVVGITCKTPNSYVDFECDTIILAIGHSARDTFEMLHGLNMPMVAKPFAVGARIEHLQSMINRSQYGSFYDNPAFGAANYKLSTHLPNGRGVYSFCMCPGGTVVASSSEEDTVVTNGMSNYARDGKNANSAILVGVTPDDFGNDHVLAGMYFQREIEKKAFAKTGGYSAPAQRVGDFLKNINTTEFGSVTPSFTCGVAKSKIDCWLPSFVTESIRLGLTDFDRKIRGFASYDAVLTGPETRSSSPVRVLRGEDMQSQVKGLYPCGEGAGYAGGIISAAVDGMRCAEAVLTNK